MWKLCNLKIVLTILIAGIAIGATSGWFFSARFLGQIWNQLSDYSAVSEAELDTRILQKLRDGETEKAIAMMEAKIDSNLIMIEMSEHISHETMDEWFFTALDNIREYRKQHPRENDTQVQEAINRAFSLQRSAGHAAP